MALMKCTFLSKSLKTMVKINVIIPSLNFEDVMSNRSKESRGNVKFQTLYLLHGYTGDESDWQRFTGIERYAENNKIAVIMPAAGNSFYTDMVHGGDYFTYLTEELPAFVQAMFPVSAKKEDTFIAGLSMGGYGAFKIAMRYPERYHAAASLSGVVEISEAVLKEERKDMKLENVFGDLNKVRGSKHDLLHLAEQLIKDGKSIPKLYQACGTEDFLYRNNIKFKKQAEQIGLGIHYVEGPGIHDWNFWDEYIRKVLEWMPLLREPIKK
ncbi:alpha/beta hydrolase [Haloplasma contractile]|uniref:S-formylglutathione hydrolase protein n=1 Tax=Haloplasma contractile SSD-17B TaxID=1033810 RepID=U2DXY1_9MOLU|nr:alpha/beta hydrolase family protein [Haloplasma contractile]ERJ13122.1 S-formylglutathione hydrolase protein [Haloplasma contractile SSD-17B]